MGVGRYATGLGRYELDDRRSGEGCLTTGGGGGAGAGNFGSGWRVETEAGAGAGGRGGSLRAGAVVPVGSTVPRLPAATGGCACGCSEWIFLGAMVSSRLLGDIEDLRKPNRLATSGAAIKGSPAESMPESKHGRGLSDEEWTTRLLTGP